MFKIKIKNEKNISFVKNIKNPCVHCTPVHTHGKICRIKKHFDLRRDLAIHYFFPVIPIKITFKIWNI